MKSDTQLRDAIASELDKELGRHRIGVAVDRGSVSLSGFASSTAQKRAAARIAHNFPETTAIFQRLVIDCLDQGDCEIESVQRFLQAIETLITREDSLDIVVEDGIARLSGILRDQEALSQVLDIATYQLEPMSVESAFELRIPVSAGQVEQAISTALARNGCSDRIELTVKIDGQHVRLGGRVSHWRERDIAHRAALAAKGVREVENSIIVG